VFHDGGEGCLSVFGRFSANKLVKLCTSLLMKMASLLPLFQEKYISPSKT
jgi:hypothetical protein